VKLVFAHHSAKLPEGKQRNECAGYDDRPADQIVEVGVAHDSAGRKAVDEALDELLEEVEAEHKQAEDKGFVEDSQVQRFGFDLPAKARPLSDENNFGNDQCIDDRERLVEITDLISFSRATWHPSRSGLPLRQPSRYDLQNARDPSVPCEARFISLIRARIIRVQIRESTRATRLPFHSKTALR
jgi:hypothetical protein